VDSQRVKRQNLFRAFVNHFTETGKSFLKSNCLAKNV
jgi:hypothetical protein